MDEITWGELDKLNSEHYASKQRPAWVYRAEEASRIADQEHGIAVDLYLDNGCEWAAVDRAEGKSLACYDFAQDCRKSWHAGLDGPEHEYTYYLQLHGLKDLIEERAADIGMTVQDIIEHPGLMPDGFPY